MPKDRKPFDISRRKTIAGLAALGSVAAAPALRAQGTRTIRWWSAQTAPDQRQAYEYQIAQFQAIHPDVEISLEATSDEGYATQLTAAFSSGEVPSLVTHLPSFAATTYWASDLLEPMDDVIAAVGVDRYYPGANEVYRTPEGAYCGTGIGNAAANMLWVRRDLLEKAGIDNVPETWDELRVACAAMQGGGVYGAPFPYARNSMTALTIIGMIHLAGGQVFSPDLDVALDSPETLDAIEFYRSMREFCPPGANSYSWGDSLGAFVSGASATAIYAGRVLTNVTQQNPSIAESVTCALYPRISRDVAPWTFNGYPSVMIPKGAPNLEDTKRFAAFLFDAEGYIRQLHAAPGHLLPVLETIGEDPRYQNNPIIKRYSGEVALMSKAAANGHNLGWETDAHKANPVAGEVVNSLVLAEMVQRVVVNGEGAKQVVGETAKRIEEIAAR